MSRPARRGSRRAALDFLAQRLDPRQRGAVGLVEAVEARGALAAEEVAAEVADQAVQQRAVGRAAVEQRVLDVGRGGRGRRATCSIGRLTSEGSIEKSPTVKAWSALSPGRSAATSSIVRARTSASVSSSSGRGPPPARATTSAQRRVMRSPMSVIASRTVPISRRREKKAELA